MRCDDHLIVNDRLYMDETADGRDDDDDADEPHLFASLLMMTMMM